MESLQQHFQNGRQVIPSQREVQRCSACVTSILAMNPSPYALNGTNCYLIGTGRSRLLLDTGEGKQGFMSNLTRAMQQAQCSSLDSVLLTHAHADHVGGVHDVQRKFGPLAVRKLTLQRDQYSFGNFGTPEDKEDPWKFDNEQHPTVIRHGDVIQTEGATLRAVHTPGHAEDHVCFFLEEERALFTGDTVLGVGTVIVTDLEAYLNSLRKLMELQPSKIYPAHGPVIEGREAPQRLAEYVEHRLVRLQTIRAQLRTLPTSLEDITDRIYRNNLPNNFLRYAARVNTQAALYKLQRDGDARRTADGRWAAPRGGVRHQQTRPALATESTSSGRQVNAEAETTSKGHVEGEKRIPVALKTLPGTTQVKPADGADRTSSSRQQLHMEVEEATSGPQLNFGSETDRTSREQQQLSSEMERASERRMEREKAVPRATLEQLESLDDDSASGSEGAKLVTTGGSEGAKRYLVEQGPTFRRKGGAAGPTGAPLSRKLAVGAEVLSTGRIWRGPQGGLWAELPKERGWSLVEGPGFGVEGPLLRGVASDEEHVVLRILPPRLLDGSAVSEAPPVEEALCEMVVCRGDSLYDLKRRLRQRTGLHTTGLLCPNLDALDCLDIPGFLAELLVKPREWLLQDEDKIIAAGFREGDELQFFSLEDAFPG